MLDKILKIIEIGGNCELALRYRDNQRYLKTNTK